MKKKKKYIELDFDSPDHLREILTIVFLNQVEGVVERFADGYEYFDFTLSFRAVRNDSATENSKNKSQTLPNIPIRDGRKLN